MRVAIIVGITLALTVCIKVAEKPAMAIRLGDGTVYFAQPPDLVNARTTLSNVNEWGATYYFTINVPPNAGEPLQRVTMTQQSGGYDIRFDLKDSRAFLGKSRRKGERLRLGNVTQEERGETVSVTFDPPVTPGKTLTIGLRPVENPRYSGIYIFGVTAFPVGEKSHGQFIGFGRLNFYSNNN